MRREKKHPLPPAPLRVTLRQARAYPKLACPLAGSLFVSETALWFKALVPESRKILAMPSFY